MTEVLIYCTCGLWHSKEERKVIEGKIVTG